MSREPLFTSGRYRVFELTEADTPKLQAFFERNPEYDLMVSGAPPDAETAHREMTEMPPPGYPFDQRWIIGFVDRTGTLVAMGNILKNLFAPGVWHIGTFIVATSLHGRGYARELYADLEAWMRANGARWIRLGVVIGNTRGERFWERSGYLDVRQRHGVRYGERENSLRVMAKPLASGSLAQYLALVARDRPDAP